MRSMHFPLMVLLTIIFSSFGLQELAAQTSMKNKQEWFLFTEDQTRLFVQEFGTGETIVALHGGFGAEHSYLLDFLLPLQDEYHIVTYDQRGSLRSPIHDSLLTQKITLDLFIEDLEQLRKELGLEKLRLVAHSMGAYLAYNYLNKYPDRVAGLVVISGFLPKFPETEEEWKILMSTQEERATFMQRPEVQKMRETIAANTSYGVSKQKTYDWKIQSAAGQVYDVSKWEKATCGFGTFNGNINPMIGPERRGGSKFNFIENLKAHPYPIEYIFGYYEFGDFGVKLHQHWLKDIDHININILDKAGHSVWVDQPEAFHQILRSALQNTATMHE